MPRQPAGVIGIGTMVAIRANGMRIINRCFPQYTSARSLLFALSALLLLGSCAYAPEQPIAYSHAAHAGKYKIECLHCHFGAERSRHAGVPPAQVCMNCHSQVKLDSPEVQKISAAVESKTPIQWVRVNRLPDHAFFDHSRHVREGNIRCQTCHGPVETMTRVRQVRGMGMGSCVACHRKSGLPGNGFKPSTDCSACHN